MPGTFQMKKESKWILGIGVVFFCLAVTCLFAHFPIGISFTLISLINIYLFALLFEATVASDNKNGWLPIWFVHIIPTRVISLFLFFIFLSCFILLFGAIYLKYGIVGKSIATTPFLAIYYSTLTTTTLGFADLSQNSHWPKGFMIYQIISSVHLFLGSFPLLLSRINKI